MNMEKRAMRDSFRTVPMPDQTAVLPVSISLTAEQADAALFQSLVYMLAGDHAACRMPS